MLSSLKAVLDLHILNTSPRKNPDSVSLEDGGPRKFQHLTAASCNPTPVSHLSKTQQRFYPEWTETKLLKEKEQQPAKSESSSSGQKCYVQQTCCACAGEGHAVRPLQGPHACSPLGFCGLRRPVKQRTTVSYDIKQSCACALAEMRRDLHCSQADNATPPALNWLG